MQQLLLHGKTIPTRGLDPEGAQFLPQDREHLEEIHNGTGPAEYAQPYVFSY